MDSSELQQIDVSERVRTGPVPKGHIAQAVTTPSLPEGICGHRDRGLGHPQGVARSQKFPQEINSKLHSNDRNSRSSTCATRT